MKEIIEGLSRAAYEERKDFMSKSSIVRYEKAYNEVADFFIKGRFDDDGDYESDCGVKYNWMVKIAIESLVREKENL